MSFKEGDFLKIEYDAWRASDNSLVYTTNETLAKEKEIYNKESRYGPQWVVVGKNNVIKGVDEALKSMDVNQQKKIEIDPRDAFGERNPELVRVLPLADFRQRDINPEAGMQIDIDGVIATIKNVSSGRVVVDANHPLAGEKMVYEVKVLNKLPEDNKEKIKAVGEMYLLNPDKIEVDGTIAKVTFGEKVNKNADYFLSKTSVVASIMNYVPGIEKVVVEEEYTKKKEETEKKQ